MRLRRRFQWRRRVYTSREACLARIPAVSVTPTLDKSSDYVSYGRLVMEYSAI